MKKLLVTLATLVVVVLSLPHVSFGLNLSALGTPTIDGVMSPGEWDNAAKLDFQANVPEGGTTPATLYVMNDGVNLYLALSIKRSSFGIQTQFEIDFDNNNNGALEAGEDVLAMIAGISINTLFVDAYHCASTTCRISPDNLALGGILPVADKPDGTGLAANDGSVTILELSHPLCSKDIMHDFCLKLGNTVGFKASLILNPIDSRLSGIGVTVIPLPTTAVVGGSNFGQITIASPVVMRNINIDIKPGSRENPINTKSEGKIPVAILSTRDWSAPEKVDRNSLTFGRTGDENSLALCNDDAQDVNNDGLPDLVCHFSTQLTGFKPGDTFGILKGKDKDGGPDFTAKDSVRIVK